MISDAVHALLGAEVAATRPVGGGCISDAQRVELTDGRVLFAKTAAGLPDDLLSVEAEGLRWLAEPGVLAVPAIVAIGAPHTSGPDVLLLEWIEPGPRRPDTDRSLGAGLALLHLSGAPGFGWHRDGYIGSLPQANTPLATDWPSFWLTRRIAPLARLAIDRRRADPDIAPLVERLATRLPDLAGPPEPPARVHGDLWSGNVLVAADGRPYLIDPAAYGGHREVDLAMLHLFGSPGNDLVSAYHENYPLADGWQERMRLWQLEPLLVHAVLFGGGYGGQARRALTRFV